MQIVWILLGSFGACLFFALLFHAPRHCLMTSSLLGTAAYGLYLLTGRLSDSMVAGVFAASILIALISELLARLQKAPATLFASVAIIPLVPGGGLYRTMLALLQQDYAAAGSAGVETILCAGCIALAIALVSSFFRVRR